MTSTTVRSTRRRRMLLGCAIGGVAGLVACDGQLPWSGTSFRGVDITGATYARQLQLPDVDGRLRTLADFKGHVVLVFFGYVQCPDVCPTILLELSEVRRSLGADGERVTGIFVTVDPERDTPELLKAYLGNFGPGIVGLRGTPEQAREAAREFNVFYNKVPGKNGGYTMDHTAGSYLFDAKGRVRVFTRYGSGAKALADDLKLLLAEPKA